MRQPLNWDNTTHYIAVVRTVLRALPIYHGHVGLHNNNGEL